MEKWNKQVCKGRVVIVPADELHEWTPERLRELPEFAQDNINTTYIVLPDKGRGPAVIRPTEVEL